VSPAFQKMEQISLSQQPKLEASKTESLDIVKNMAIQEFKIKSIQNDSLDKTDDESLLDKD